MSDRLWLFRALVASKWSSDPHTKVGVVIVRDGGLVAHAYNAIPFGVSDAPKTRHQRPEKYLWYEHAERNAIFLAAREGVALEGATLYSTHEPCQDCARAIIQSGITRLVYYSDSEASSNWDYQVPRMMLKEASIEVVAYEKDEQNAI